MIPKSRKDIYDYIYGLLFGVVSDNVYPMNESQELTKSDVNDGFIVIRVGTMVDESEFKGEAFGWCRVYVEAYVPPMSRGRLDEDKYYAFEDAINEAIDSEVANGTSEDYSILEDGIISWDDFDGSNANNVFYKFIKSFRVQIFNKQ